MNWQSIERFASFPKMETELEYRITQREAKEILALRADLAALRARIEDVEGMAKVFHEAYEILAPTYEYTTRKESAVAWDYVPDANKQLMIATARTVSAWLKEG